MDTRNRCRHCGHPKTNRPRGLCWSCYYRPGVKEQYPSTSKFARRGVGNFVGNAPLADAPTNALPRTAEKLAVMHRRARLGQAIFHPFDATFERRIDLVVDFNGGPARTHHLRILGSQSGTASTTSVLMAPGSLSARAAKGGAA